MDRLSVSKTILAAGRTSLFHRAVPAACALLALCGGLWVAKGQAVFTEYTGTLTRVALVDVGTLECLNGQPTGVPWYLGTPCSPADSRVRIRGVVIKYYEQTSDPRTTGWLYVTINANLDQWPGTGPFWGTGRLEVAPGVVWEGIWTGKRVLNTSETLHAVLQGSGGIVEGLKSESDISLLLGSSPVTYTVTGTILQPAGK